MGEIDSTDASIGSRLAAAVIGRRKLIGSFAAVSAVATVGMPAFAASDANLRTFHARYAIHGGSILAGYFAAPKGQQGLDVVVVLGDEATTPAQVEASARRYANAGYLAIAPDLAATYRDQPLASRAAMVDHLMKALPNLKRLPQGSGTVKVVSA